MTEKGLIWKDVVGYEGLYKVSIYGDVFSLKRANCYRESHMMTPCDDGRGYPMVCLCKNGKKKARRVHRIVAEAFIPNPHNCREINHIDENKGNCHVENLEWCDRSYNVNYGSRTKKTCHSVNMYSEKMELLKTYKSIREACRDNGFKCPGNISNVLHGKAIRAYGFIWKEVK